MVPGGPIAMSIELHRIMAWFSPAFPVGAFSYSHGLEAAIANGQVNDGAALRPWLSHIIRQGSGRNDCILLANSYRAATQVELEALVELADALCAGHERQFESRQMGAAFAKTVSEVTAISFDPAPMPVVVGQVARRLDVALDMLLPIYLHSFVANLVSVAMRMIPMGQVEGQKILASLFDEIDDIATGARSAALSELGGASFYSDLCSLQHETLQPRIFRT